jgi:hypothetical protein
MFDNTDDTDYIRNIYAINGSVKKNSRIGKSNRINGCPPKIRRRYVNSQCV